MTSMTPSARSLRTMVRHWRRGRAELTYGEWLSDAYITLFTTTVVSAMAISAVLDLRGAADLACTGSCPQVRALVPWLAVLVVAALAVGLARLMGPIFSAPAASSWMLSTPVDRGALLRPTWLWTLAATLGVSIALLGTPVLLAGVETRVAVAALATGAAASLGSVALGGWSQARGNGGARLFTWTIVAVLWALLAVAAVGRVELLTAPSAGTGFAVAAAIGAAAITLAVVVTVRLRRVTRETLGQTAGVPAALSGSLASLDLGLMYDVLLGRRWSGAAVVRTRRGGPRGWGALLHRDLVRVARSPQPFVVLAGMLLLVHAVAAADVARSMTLVVSGVGFVVGPSLAPALRVITRSASLVRMLPFSAATVRGVHVVVPAVALLAFGLAASSAFSGFAPPGEALVLGVACGLSALAATVRWVVGAPPDYAAPLLATPVGAIPPGVLLGLFRGVDVWVVTAVPLLLGGRGVVVSVVLSVGVLWWIVTEGGS